jgi:hypothetical protein
MAQMHTCEELWDLMSAYADGMSTRDESSRIERHVAICPDCARDLRFMHETAHVLAETPEVVPPACLRDSILAATIYRPTWQDRVRAAARKLVPTSPLRALAYAGGAAAILLVAYVSSSWAPRLPAGEPHGDIAAITHPPSPTRTLPSTPNISGPARLATSDTVKDQPATARPEPEQVAPSPDESVISPPTAAPRIVQATSRTKVDPTLRARAESALLARADSGIRGFGRKTASRRDVASARPNVNELIPNLQPERSEQPRENLAQPAITMADMKVPMTGMDPEMPMPMRDPMTGSDTAVATAGQPAPRMHITLASVANGESAAPSSIMTLADLRRQLRHQNSSSSESMHPELRLRARRDTLDVVKSTF